MRYYKPILSRIHWPLAVDDMVGIELASGMELLMIGLWLSLPFVTLADTPIYQPMYALLPHEWVWASIVIVLGFFQIWSIVHSHILSRRVAAFVAFFTWFFMAGVTFMGNRESLAAPVYATLAILCGWAYLRLSLSVKRP